MADKTFNEPRLAINRIYTRMGDRGETALVGGQRVGKDSPRIECYGTVDELNTTIALARISAGELAQATPALAGLKETLTRIQQELFNLGSVLATLPQDVRPQQARITPEDVRQLEREIDQANADLAPLRSFVLPGGSRLSAELHVARTVCRRAERLLVTLSRSEDVPEASVEYLNRLSDALFVWSRWANHILGIPETLWSPNAASSARSK